MSGSPNPSYYQGDMPTDWYNLGSKRVKEATYGLQKDQNAALGSLYDMATGKASASQQQAAQQQQAMAAAIQSRSATAQRGGYDAATARTAQQAGMQANQAIGAQGSLAAAQEKQAAGQLYSQAAQGSLQGQLAGSALQRGYTQLGAQDAYKAAASGMSAQDYWQKIAYEMKMSQEARDSYYANLTSGAIGMGVDTISGLTAASDRRVKADIRPAGRALDALLASIGGA